VLENRGHVRDVLRGLDVEGEPGRRNHLAADLVGVGATGRAFMMRFLAALTVVLLLLGLVPLPVAQAETAGKGEALGILVLVGLLKPAPPSGARAAAEKPKPSLQGAPKTQGRAAEVKSPRPAVKDGQGRLDQLVRVPR
jgi:hypothetical protein